jgi:hypothetical protein
MSYHHSGRQRFEIIKQSFGLAMACPGGGGTYSFVAQSNHDCLF